MPKPRPRIQRQVRPIVEEPMVLRLKEKYQTLYFHIPDEPTLFKVALDILQKRHKSGNWYFDPLKGMRTSAPGMTQEEAEKLPVGAIRESALRKVAAYDEEIRKVQGELEDWKDLQTALEEKDGRKAWHVLKRYGDGEYAGVELEQYMGEYYG